MQWRGPVLADRSQGKHADTPQPLRLLRVRRDRRRHRAADKRDKLTPFQLV
jgi:hypothetical protein